MEDRERPSFEESNNVTVKRCFFAYEYAAPLLKHKTTADIGCADGYGTQYLADFVQNITGVDYSEITVEAARQKHADKKNLSFISSSVPPLPFENESLDVVTAFQFIEHIHQRPAFMKEVYRVLKPGGLFLCTTPNRLMSIARNPFHVFEYTFEEIKNEAGAIFDSIELQGLQGNEKVNQYYEENAKWAKKILKWDPLGIHKLIPASLLVTPYNWLTTIMRKELKAQNQATLEIQTSDFYLTDVNLNQTWDIFLTGHKKA